MRILTLSKDSTDFSSNDYLGLARSEALGRLLNCDDPVAGYHGSTGSRLLTGNSAVAMETEQALAARWQMESTLIFPSGYMANLGLLSALPGRKDLIIYDQKAHACIKDGARLSLAERISFRHNDLDHLRSQLNNSGETAYVVVESLYSMDGDVAPLEDICAICEQFGARLIVDEAHATAVEGAFGGGITEVLGLTSRIFARVNTFGKGLGLHGASVSGVAWLKDYLVNHSRPFIYTTAPPPSLFRQIQRSFEFLDTHLELRETLRNRIDYFLATWRTKAGDRWQLLPATHAIQAVVIPGEDRVRQVAEMIQARGFDVRPILSPTVPKGAERLRICLHSYNTEQEINGLIDAFVSFKKL